MPQAVNWVSLCFEVCAAVVSGVTWQLRVAQGCTAANQGGEVLAGRKRCFVLGEVEDEVFVLREELVPVNGADVLLVSCCVAVLRTYVSASRSLAVKLSSGVARFDTDSAAPFAGRARANPAARTKGTRVW